MTIERRRKQSQEVRSARRKGTRKRRSSVKWPIENSKDLPTLDYNPTALLKILYSFLEKLAESHPKIIYEIKKCLE